MNEKIWMRWITFLLVFGFHFKCMGCHFDYGSTDKRNRSIFIALAYAVIDWISAQVMRHRSIKQTCLIESAFPACIDFPILKQYEPYMQLHFLYNRNSILMQRCIEPGGCCKAGKLSKSYLKLKSREILTTTAFISARQIVSQICREHGSDYAVFCVTFQNDLTNKTVAYGWTRFRELWISDKHPSLWQPTGFIFQRAARIILWRNHHVIQGFGR